MRPKAIDLDAEAAKLATLQRKEAQLATPRDPNKSPPVKPPTPTANPRSD